MTVSFWLLWKRGELYVSDVFTSGRQDTSQIMIMVPLWELQKQKRDGF